MTYDVDYFIKKFELTKEHQWCSHAFSDGLGAHCAQGHCGVNTQNSDRVWYNGIIPEAQALASILFPVVEPEYHKTYEDKIRRFGNVAEINNGYHSRYKQPTPKQRILAALYDIKKLQQPEVKERIVYVTVDAEVRELQSEELCKN